MRFALANCQVFLTPSKLCLHEAIYRTHVCVFYFLERLLLCYRSFKVHPLASHLKPVGKKSLAASDMASTGPFIFSSLRRNAKDVKKTKSKTKRC